MQAGVCSVAGFPPPPPRPGPPQSSRLRVTKPGKCSEMPLSGSPSGSRLHAKPTRPAFPKKTSRLDPALAASASRSRSGSRPLPGGPCYCGRERDWAERASLPTPHVGLALRRAWTPPPRYSVTPPPAAPPPGMGGGLKSRGGRGASPSQVVPGVPRGRTEGTRCLGLCTRSTDRASCSRAAADHAWPREPIGSSLTHLCR